MRLFRFDLTLARKDGVHTISFSTKVIFSLGLPRDWLWERRISSVLKNSLPALKRDVFL